MLDKLIVKMQYVNLTMIIFYENDDDDGDDKNTGDYHWDEWVHLIVRRRPGVFLQTYTNGITSSVCTCRLLM